MGKKERLRGKLDRSRGTLGLYHEAESQEAGGRSSSGQIALRLSGSPERLKWRAGIKMKAPYLSLVERGSTGRGSYREQEVD